jgi:ABC-type lipoprotein export system ATPase subunit
LARAFYRALDRKVDYLFLDEPTSALDDERANEVLKSLMHLAATGVAVVVISHQHHLIASADRVIEVGGV